MGFSSLIPPCSLEVQGQRYVKRMLSQLQIMKNGKEVKWEMGQSRIAHMDGPFAPYISQESLHVQLGSLESGQ